jgi:hypothetical protein
MAHDSLGTKNQPQYSATGASSQAADLSEVANYAANIGNRRVDTSTVRTGLTGADVWEGLEFEETDTGYVYTYHTTGGWILTRAGIGGSVKRSSTPVTLTGPGWSGLSTPADWVTDQAVGGGLAAFNGTFHAPIAGVYDVRLGMQFDSAVNAILVLKKNDTTASSTGNIASIVLAGFANYTAGVVAKRIRMNAGDYVAGAIYLSANAVWNTAAPDASFFSVDWVEALR